MKNSKLIFFYILEHFQDPENGKKKISRKIQNNYEKINNFLLVLNI